MRNAYVSFTIINGNRFQDYYKRTLKNIESVAVKMFHLGWNLSPTIMNDIFSHKDNSLHNLREISESSRPLVKSIYDGSERASFLGLKIWNMLPNDCKALGNFSTFKNKVELKPQLFL